MKLALLSVSALLIAHTPAQADVQDITVSAPKVFANGVLVPAGALCPQVSALLADDNAEGAKSIRAQIDNETRALAKHSEKRVCKSPSDCVVVDLFSDDGSTLLVLTRGETGYQDLRILRMSPDRMLPSCYYDLN